MKSLDNPWGVTVVCLTLLLAGGCEEKVVGVNHNFSTAPPDPSERYVMEGPRQREAKPGVLESVGEFLFGWTRVFAAEKQPPPAAKPVTYVPGETSE